MDGKVLEAELRALAARQHGVVSRAQARRLGASRRSLARRVAGPGWEAPAPQVLRLVGTTDTFSQRCLAGAVDVGPSAVVSRTAAAALWGLPGFFPGDVHVTRPWRPPAGPAASPSSTSPGTYPNTNRTSREAIPLTTVARTVFDLAGCLHPGRTERAMENALEVPVGGPGDVAPGHHRAPGAGAGREHVDARAAGGAGRGMHPSGQRVGGGLPGAPRGGARRAARGPGRPGCRRLDRPCRLLLPASPPGDRDRQRRPPHGEARCRVGRPPRPDLARRWLEVSCCRPTVPNRPQERARRVPPSGVRTGGEGVEAVR